MWWYGRGNSGGLWLPEEKKANMWHGRRNSGGSWPPAFPRSTVQILKSFEFMHYMACNKYYLISFSWGIAKIFMRNIMKYSDLNFVIMRNFVQKNYLFRNFVRNCFRIDTKMMPNSVQNHETVAQEN